jgi:hypothetical protein
VGGPFFSPVAAQGEGRWRRFPGGPHASRVSVPASRRDASVSSLPTRLRAIRCRHPTPSARRRRPHAGRVCSPSPRWQRGHTCPLCVPRLFAIRQTLDAGRNRSEAEIYSRRLPDQGERSESMPALLWRGAVSRRIFPVEAGVYDPGPERLALGSGNLRWLWPGPWGGGRADLLANGRTCGGGPLRGHRPRLQRGLAR